MANPNVHHTVDDIVLGALERDPRRRWGTAADMRDRIRAVAERLGEQASDRGTIEWVNWAFDQKQGRAVQLTPMMPMPVYSAPAAEGTSSAATATSQAPRRLALALCVVALLLLVIGVAAWALIR
jgi:hypothetical protein